MSAIKHLEKLRSAAYFRDGALPCIVREMRQAPSNAFIAMHDHEFSELVIVASGKINHIHAGQTDRLSRGDFFVIHPGEQHGYAELTDGTVVFNLLYDSKMPPPALLAKGGPIVTHIFPKDCAAARADVLGRIPSHDLPHIVKLIQEIRREESTKRPLGNNICTALFTAVVFLLTRAADQVWSDASDNLPFRRAIDFIEQNFSHKIVIGELCEISGLSASTLHRTFKRITGKSPGDYLIDVRTAKAKTLLAQPGATLGTVAHQTGFCGASHLSRTLNARRM